MPLFGGQSVQARRQPLFGQNFSAGEKITGFGLSALESFPELFGIEPSRTTQAYRAQNPVSGFLSQAVGAFVPYVGAAKLARAAPLTGNFIRRAEGLGRGSVSRMALGSMAEAAVVETGRIGLGVSGLPGAIYEGATGRTAEMRGANDLLLEGAFNIGASGLGGAVFGALAGRFARRTPFGNIRGLEMGAAEQPLPVRIRAFNEFIRRAEDPADPLTVAPELVQRVSRERNNLINMNLAGVLPKISDNGVSVSSGRYRSEFGNPFRPIIAERKNAKSSGEVSSFFNRLAKGKGGGGLTRTMRIILDPKKGFANEREMAEALGGAGLAREEIAMETTDAFVLRITPGVGRKPSSRSKLPPAPNDAARLLSTPPDRAASNNLTRAQSIQKRLTSGKAVQKIGNGWHLFREAGDDGMFVITKKVRGGLEPAEGDEWMILRTDNPGYFDPQSAKLQKEMLRSGYFPEAPELTKTGIGIWNADNDILELVGKNVGTSNKKAVPGGRFGAAVSELFELGGDKLAPSGPGAARHPLANLTMQRMKGLEAFVEDKVDVIMRGNRILDPSKSMSRQILGFKETASDGLHDMAMRLTQEQADQWAEVLRMEVPVEALDDLMVRGVLDEPVVALLKAQQQYSDKLLMEAEELNKIVTNVRAEQLTGQFIARKGHYSISRERPGAYRQFLNDADGEIVGEVAANNPVDLQVRAQEVIEEYAKKGRELYEGAFVDTVLADAGEIAKYQAAIRKPGFINARGNLLGHELEGKQVKPADISRLIERNIKRRENFIRDIVMVEKTADAIAQLDREAPNMAGFIRARLRLYQGDEGEFGRAQNMILDKTLGIVGFSGKDTASGIVLETQKVLSDFQFGFANLVNPMQNLMGIFQTVLPEISFASRISQASAHNYVSLPVFDSANRLTGSVNMLSDVKLFYSAMKNAGKQFGDLDPSHQELIYQMMKERYLAPRFAEEQFGLNGALLADPKRAFESTESFIEFFGAANRVLVTKSEEFNRMIALNAAYEIAKMRGMNQGQMTIFTREFLSKTAFNYGTVDRATVFTTPIGSLLGTFKNWMFHYTANMIKYAGGGKETLPAFFWQTGATALIGGAAATPFIVPLAEGASRFLTDKPLIESLYAGLGADNEELADGLLYGLPGMMGVSFSSQVGSPGADPERDATMMFSLAMGDRMRALGGAVKDGLSAYAVTGESPFTDDGVRDQIVRALAPRTIYRAMAAAENGAIRSMASGYDVARLGPGSNALYALGFNPTELEKTYAVYEQVRNNQNKKKALVTEFGKTLAQAWEDGDNVLATRVFTRATAVGVDTSSVLRSARARGERAEETQLEYAITPEEQAAYGFMFQ